MHLACICAVKVNFSIFPTSARMGELKILITSSSYIPHQDGKPSHALRDHDTSARYKMPANRATAEMKYAIESSFPAFMAVCSRP